MMRLCCRGLGGVFVGLFLVLTLVGAGPAAPQQGNSGSGEGQVTLGPDVEENSSGSFGIFSRAVSGGPLVFMVLNILVLMSIATWAVVFAKWIHLNKLDKTTTAFVKSFWESRSLNELNSRLGDYPYSPVREVFRLGYTELVRGNQLREQVAIPELALTVAVDNLTRALNKAKTVEKRRMEKFLSVLSISASAAPFIGLFGTVWGIMGAFEGIARSGSASLAAVAPGISEALIATAFGLAAAIPAVVGYNLFSAKLREQVSKIDSFSADFLNIVERYLVTDRTRSPNPAGITERI